MKNGRGPPTSLALRPRVLTPRGHFAHRGGGRGLHTICAAQAEATLAKYFSTYRRLDEYLRAASNRAVTERSCRTGSGRLVRFRFDPHDRKAVSEIRRRGRNSPIRGTGADILKRALRFLHNDLRNTSAQIVNIIHDEVVIECDEPDGPEISDRVCKQMVAAGEQYIQKVPVIAEPKIAACWLKD